MNEKLYNAFINAPLDRETTRSLYTSGAILAGGLILSILLSKK